MAAVTRAEVGHIKIEISVVVSVAGSASHTVSGVVDSRSLSRIYKPAFTLVAIKGIHDQSLTVGFKHPATVDEIDIEPAVAIEVPKQGAAPERFREMLFRRRTVFMAETHAGFDSHVDKTDGYLVQSTYRCLVGRGPAPAPS